MFLKTNNILVTYNSNHNHSKIRSSKSSGLGSLLSPYNTSASDIPNRSRSSSVNPYCTTSLSVHATCADPEDRQSQPV